MISYEQYENKIKKVAKVRKFCKKFSFLFVALFALVVAAIATLLARLGTLSGEITINSSTYGDGYADPEGVSSFISGVKYEYAREGSDEWVREKPVKAGKYLVRAVAKKAIGKNYTAPVAFEIKPLEVEFSILSDSVEYGGVPSQFSLNLLAGDTLDKNALLFKYDDYVSSRTGIDLIESSVKITNGGDDRSGSYLVRHEKKELDIRKRSIDISLEKTDFVYSGSEIDYASTPSQGTLYRLANGDELRISSVELQQNGVAVQSALRAGRYSALAQSYSIYKVIDGVSIDVTSQYDMHELAVSFEIARKQLSITTPSAEKIYDGTPLKKADGFSVEGLVASDSLAVYNSSEITSVRRVGSGVLGIENEFSDYRIAGAGGEDMRDNYDISWQRGTLTVQPRQITVSSPSGSWEYDGTPQSDATIVCTDEYFEAISNYTKGMILTVGSIENAVDYTLVSKATGEAADKQNFTISENWGTLTVTPRPIAVTIDSVEKIYDGRPLFATPENGEVHSARLALYDELVSDTHGKLFSLTSVKRASGVVGSAPVEGVQNESEYKIVCGASDRTDCYDITYIRGTLTVYPRHITVQTNSARFIYDGEPHSDAGYTVYENGEITGLIAGNTLTPIEGMRTFTNVAETENAINNNVCAYDAGNNYEIDEIIFGTITITPRQLRVSTLSETFIYDGQPHFRTDYSTIAVNKDLQGSSSGLLNGDTLTVLSYTQVVNVADTYEQNNICEYAVPNDNYEIVNRRYGTLTILARSVRITSPSQSWVYDGQEHSLAEVSFRDLDKGGSFDAIVVKGAPVVTVKNVTAPSVENIVSYAIVNAKGEEENRDNFLIDEQWGVLSVTARLIALTSPNASWIYDGEVHSKVEITCTDDIFTAVADGERIASIKNFGIALNQIDYSIRKRATGEKETDLSNFMIEEWWGTLTVLSREIRVVTDSAEKEYDGEPLSKEVYLETYHLDEKGEKKAGLLNGDKLTVKDHYSITNVKDSGDNKCTFKEPNENYKIIGYDCGTLTLTPKAVDPIKLWSLMEIYGEELKYPEGKGNFANSDTCGFIGDDTVEVTVAFDFTDFGYQSGDRIPVRWIDGEICAYEDVILLSNTVFYGSDEANYTIEHYEKGALQIMRRSVHVVLFDLVQTHYGEDIYTENGKSAVYPVGWGNVEGVYFMNGGTTFFNKAGMLDGDYVEIIDVKYKDYPEQNPNGQNGSGTSDEYVTPKNAAYYQIYIKEVWIHTADWQIEKTTDEVDAVNANYLIEAQTFGILQILPRPIEVTLNQIETRMYDGEARTYTAGGEEVILESSIAMLFKKPEGLVFGETLQVKVAFDSEPIFFGTYSYSFDRENSYILNADGSVNEWKLGNYRIICKNGSVEITKRPVTIKMNDLELVYGDELSYTSSDIYFVVGDIDFVAGERIYTWSGIQFGQFGDDGRLSVGEHAIVGAPSRINYHLTKSPPITNVIDSYDIKVLAGTLTITPKEVTVTTWKRSGVYGTSGPNDWVLKFSNTPLAYDETMDIEFTYFQNGDRIAMPKDVGFYDIQLTPVLSTGEEGLKNYSFTYMNGDKNPSVELVNGFFEGMLEIYPLAITVTVSPVDTVYGEDMGEVFISVSRKLPYDERLTVSLSCQKNGEKVVPKYAGEYEIVIGELLVNDSAEGMKNYDVTERGELKNGTFTINPRPITVQLDKLSLIYGEEVCYASGNDGTNYVITEGNLVYGDTLFIMPDFGLSATSATRPDAGKYDITAKQYVVLNGEVDTVDGYLIADSYLLQIDSAPLTVEKRTIELTLNAIDLPVYYDGLAHNYVAGGEFIGGMGMAAGEELQVAVKYYFGEEKNEVSVIGKAGEYSYEFDPENSLVVNGGEKGLDNYTVISESGSVTLLYRTLVVTVFELEDRLYGSSVTYPSGVGNYQSIDNQPTIGRGLVSGEELEIFAYFRNTEKTSEKYPTDSVLPVGTYRIMGDTSDSDFYREPVVTGSEFADVNNYRVFYETTTFSVTQRSIFVWALDVTADYGETPTYPMTSENYLKITDQGVAEGEELTVGEVEIAMPAQATVGEYSGVVRIKTVRIERDGVDVTANYNTTTSFAGKLIVVPREVQVTTNSNHFVYDGKSHSDDGFTVSYQGDASKGLAYDDIGAIHADYLGALPSVTDYREEATVNEFAIVIKRGAEDVSSNYIISYTYGEIQIDRRIIFVKTKDLEKVYDGTPLYSTEEIEDCYHYLDNDIKNEKVAGLVDGEYFTFWQISRTDAGIVLNDTVKDILNEKGDSTLYNYIIETQEYGSLIVHKRQIFVDASSARKVYDGTPLYSPDDNYTLSFYPDNDTTKEPLTGESNVLASGHSFATEAPSITDAGWISNNKFTGVVAGTADVTGNYEIISRSGDLIVDLRPVSIWIEDINMVYCNAAPESLNYSVEAEGEDRGMLAGEKDDYRFTVKVVQTGTNTVITRYNAGVYDILCEAYNTKGKNNYDFDVEKRGVLTIEKALLVLSPPEKSADYTSYDQELFVTANEVRSIEGTALAAGDKLVSLALSGASLKASSNKSSSSVRIQKNSVVLEDAITGESVLDNYDIVLASGSLIFNIRTVYYEQIVPDGIRKSETGRGLLPYSGAKREFLGDCYRLLAASEIDTAAERAGWVGLDENIDFNLYGVLASDEIELKSASVQKQVRVYDQWVTLGVINKESGKSVARLYCIVLVMRAGTDTAIEVLPVNVTVSFNAALNAEYLEDLKTGYTVLGAEFVDSVTGLIDDHVVEAVAYKDEAERVTIYIFIYTPKTSGSRTDRSSIYAVNAEFESEVEVGVELMGTSSYPQGEEL